MVMRQFRIALLRISVILVLFSVTGCRCDDDDEFDYRLDYVYGGFGSEPGQFNTPLGIQARGVPTAGHPRLFVADYGNHRVQALGYRPGPSSSPDTVWVFGERPAATSTAFAGE